VQLNNSSRLSPQEKTGQDALLIGLRRETSGNRRHKFRSLSGVIRWGSDIA
jgi:hypothetical protein